MSVFSCVFGLVGGSLLVVMIVVEVCMVMIGFWLVLCVGVSMMVLCFVSGLVVVVGLVFDVVGVFVKYVVCKDSGDV